MAGLLDYGIMQPGPTMAADRERRKTVGSRGLLEAIGAPMSFAPNPVVNAIGQGLLGARYLTGEADPTEGAKSLSDITAMAVGSRLPAPLRNIITYHGSPHKFDKFDSSKIGTGEGAQAYGHGLYLAESPDVAGKYQRALADKVQRGRAIADAAGKEMPIGNAIDADALAALDMVSAGKALPKNHASIFSKAIAEQDKITRTATDPNAVARAGQVKQRLLDLKNSGARLFDEQSNLYKVDLPDSAVAKMLDWDKPLSQQAGLLETARAAMHKGPQEKLRMDAWVRDNPNATGGDLIKQLERLYGVRYANKALGTAGIPGIRYLDGGSRSTGQGTSNFVVFPGEEGLLKILERNGQPMGLLGR